MSRSIGFIGTGQMGGALISGFIGAGLVRPRDVYVSDVETSRLELLQADFGVMPAGSNVEAARLAETLVLAVKPQQLLKVVEEVAQELTADKVVVTIAAGVTTRMIEEQAGREIRLVRVMPNSPALVGSSASVVSPGRFADREAVERVLELFGSVGEALELPEEFQNRVTAISGSGPAYFYYMVEELVGAAVELGIPDGIAKRLVVATIVGSARMLAETGQEPVELRRMVTSPGGTTEAAIAVFEGSGLGGVIRGAVGAAVARAEDIGK